MSATRHHIAILFDPCILDAQSQTVKLKKANYQLDFQRSFLSLILESISEYIRIIFDLHPSFITFDIISCGNKIHSQTSIIKSGYIRCLERFHSIIGISSCSETKFVEAMERFLLELPSDFYNSHKYSSPFNSHQSTINNQQPITHIIFITRNQDNIQNYKYLINKSLNKQIDFIKQCFTAKKRNHSIKKVYILKYQKGENIIKKWTKIIPNNSANSDNNNNDIDIKDNKDNDDDDDIDIAHNFAQNNNDDDIDFYSTIIGINALHSSLLNLICNIQFSSIIRLINIVSVPFKDPSTSIKTQLTIPMICCINNISHSHLYNTMYFQSHYSTATESITLNEYNNITELSWCKIPDLHASNSFDWSDWITRNIILITPAKLNDTSRLLMKFINKKKIATLRAHYLYDNINNNNYIKSDYNNKPRITHCVRLIGLQIYLVSVIYVKDIQGYSTKLQSNNNINQQMNQQIINNKFPFYEYCLQSSRLSNIAHNTSLTHCFKSVINNVDAIQSIVNVQPPFYDNNNKLNIMEINDGRNNNNIDNNKEIINNFGKKKQFISSTGINEITKTFYDNFKNQIGVDLTATEILKTDNNNSNNNCENTNISLFDMVFNS